MHKNKVLPLILILAISLIISPRIGQAQTVDDQTDLIIDDFQFVLGPDAGKFQVEQYLQLINSNLATYHEWTVTGEYLSCAEIIDRIASHYSISPKVLLTIMELQAKSISELGGDVSLLQIVPDTLTSAGLYSQLDFIANELVSYYYSYKNTNKPESGLNAASYALIQYFQDIHTAPDQESLVSDINPDSFYQTYLFLFEEDPRDPVITINLTESFPTNLKLPWEAGKVWYLTSGPHGYYGYSWPRSSLDLAPSGQEWAVSSAPGKARRIGRNEVLLDLDKDENQGTGYVLTYFHLAESSIQIPYDTWVDVGSARNLGIPSTEGGDASGVHLHFSIIHNGEYIDIDGLTLSGWVVSAASSQYDGTMTKDGITKTAWSYSNPPENDLISDNTPCYVPPRDSIVFYKDQNRCGSSEYDYKVVPLSNLPIELFYDESNRSSNTINFHPASVYFPEPLPTQSIESGNGIYSIRSTSGNYVIDLNLDKAQTDPVWGNPIILWWWHGWNNQRWKFIPVDANEYQIQSLYYHNICLSDNGRNVATWGICSGDTINLRWKYELLSNGNWLITNSASNRILTALRGPSNLGSAVLLSPPLGVGNPEWQVCPIIRNKAEVKTETGVVDQRMFESGRIDHPEVVRSIYITGFECPQPGIMSVDGLSSCNQAPNSPNPSWPYSAYGNVDTPPGLSWNSGGDFDGDVLDFQVEISGGVRTIYSIWMRNLSWYPEELVHAYGTYQWRVRARDPLSAISPWSESRSFSIFSPNGLPTIDFQLSNSSSAVEIYTRETTWTFTGTASDPEGQLSRVEFRCAGDNCGTQSAHSGIASWSHTQTNLSGWNEIYFVAYDAYTVYDPAGQSAASRRVTLLIDLAAPSTAVGLNGTSSGWSTWFTAPVQVTLTAVDGSTGMANSGIKQTHYRLDNGTWQVQAGASVNFIVSQDGVHTVEYFAEDNVGNLEPVQSAAFQIDQTPPVWTANAQETGGALNDTWQKEQNAPTFSWQPAVDALSGLAGYQLYFGKDLDGIGYDNFPAASPRQWLPQPGGVHTGVYYLRGRVQDIAGNWSDWTTLFTFKYDGTPPENPVAVTHTAPITSTLWQSATNTASFNWLVPNDEGSGIQGYYIYWGGSITGTASTFTAQPDFVDATPLCAIDSACTGYFRVRSVDNVDNLANDWSTLFELRYDNAPPDLDFDFGVGVTQTTQTQIPLNLSAFDLGSGLRSMRFSGDGLVWTAWEEFNTQRVWVIPPISRQNWPIYAQVQDWVGLPSLVISHTIYLDVNPSQSHSANFRLFDQYASAGSGEYASPAYTGRGTLGQNAQADAITSTQFILWSGYEAGSQAIPIIEPGHDDYNYINSAVGSGQVSEQMASASFRLIGVFGEAALANNETTLSSASFSHQPGFLAARPSPPLSTPEPTPGPEPDPLPMIACEQPFVYINQDNAFTNNLRVELTLCAPQAIEMMISNREDFSGAVWEPFSATRSWVMDAQGQFVSPRFIYARFRDANHVVDELYFDDILYDPNCPSGEILLTDSGAFSSDLRLTQGRFYYENGSAWLLPQGVANGQALMVLSAQDETGAVNLYMAGYDDNSGVAEMQISSNASFTDTTTWQSYVPVIQWIPPGKDGAKTVYARYRDEAGNVSPVVQASFIYDVQPPFGWISFDNATYASDAVTLTLFTYAYDGFGAGYAGLPPTDNYQGVVTDMRYGFEEDLSQNIWRPYTTSVTLPMTALSITETLPAAVYVQFRDLADNHSPVYSDTFRIDSMAPLVYEVSLATDSALTPMLHIWAQDDLSHLSLVRLSSDYNMQKDSQILPYASAIPLVGWRSQFIWVQVADAVGNWSEPYPLYLGDTVAVRVFLPLVQR